MGQWHLKSASHCNLLQDFLCFYQYIITKIVNLWPTHHTKCGNIKASTLQESHTSASFKFLNYICSTNIAEGRVRNSWSIAWIHLDSCKIVYENLLILLNSVCMQNNIFCKNLLGFSGESLREWVIGFSTNFYPCEGKKRKAMISLSMLQIYVHMYALSRCPWVQLKLK